MKASTKNTLIEILEAAGSALEGDNTFPVDARDRSISQICETLIRLADRVVPIEPPSERYTQRSKVLKVASGRQR